MKYLVLIFSILSMSGLKAETIETLKDESTEVLKCPPVAVEIKPDTAVQTELVGEKKLEEKVAESLEAELLPTKNLTVTEKLKVYRTKLEERNLVLLEKKLEMIRLEQEMALLKNLENAMNKTLRSLESL